MTDKKKELQGKIATVVEKAKANDRAMKKLTERVAEFFNDDDPIERVTLRGHFLIEMHIENACKVSLPHPDEIKWDRMFFGTKFQIFKSLYKDKVSGEMLRDIKDINDLRNNLAHAKAEEFNNAIAKFVESRPELKKKLVENDSIVAGAAIRVVFTLARLYGEIAAKKSSDGKHSIKFFGNRRPKKSPR